MPEQARILIVDDDPIVAESLAEMLAREGYGTTTAGDGNEAIAILNDADHHGGNGRNGDATQGSNGSGVPAQPCGYSVLITDLNMPRCNGLELLRRLRKRNDAVVPIVITGYGKIESAVEAIKNGAADYLTKPVIDDELRMAVQKAMRQHQLLAENHSLKSQLTQRYGLDNIVGADYRMQKVYDLVDAVAESKTTVLIGGESGTGKSMIARAIHTHSPRRAKPFTTFACGAIPETLLESELFGHVKGAFTGADKDKTGKILSADGGTLFIDEINSATPSLQLKLLRVIQEKQFEPVGSTQTVHADVRFVLATNQELGPLVEAGQFREDLFYRINVVNIRLPPLRERMGDVALLVESFLAKYAKEAGKDRRISEEAISTLNRYAWPGNVRELENAIERAVVLSRRPVIEPEDLPEVVLQGASARVAAGSTSRADQGSAGRGTATSAITDFIPALRDGWTPTALVDALLEPEKRILLAALSANNWNRQETARQLGINRTTLYKKIKHFRLDEPGS